jgi:WhiB family redox-sensing transcriptional regulator
MDTRIGTWVGQAACRGLPAVWWFPGSHASRSSIRRAKAVCADCPVLDDCRRWALAHPRERGIWGGMTEGERRALRQRKRVA